MRTQASAPKHPGQPVAARFGQRDVRGESGPERQLPPRGIVPDQPRTTCGLVTSHTVQEHADLMLLSQHLAAIASGHHNVQS